MAQWRSFNASNEKNTCLWCGNKLRPHIKSTYEAGTLYPISKEQDGWGDYGDGFFCGLRCAYQFAECLAKDGRRLAKGGRRLR